MKDKIANKYFKRGKQNELSEDFLGSYRDFLKAQSFGYPGYTNIENVKKHAISHSEPCEEAFGIALGAGRNEIISECMRNTMEYNYRGQISNEDFMCLSVQVTQVISDGTLLAETEVPTTSYNNRTIFGTIVNKNISLYEGPYFLLVKPAGNKTYMTVLGAMRTVPAFSVWGACQNMFRRFR
jgi:hypothetical protein